MVLVRVFLILQVFSVFLMNLSLGQNQRKYQGKRYFNGFRFFFLSRRSLKLWNSAQPDSVVFKVVSVENSCRRIKSRRRKNVVYLKVLQYTT